ncbi:5-dehydro-2-deoxygluconokinase [Roseibium sediminis]|uniref:5-dehydro-2-deoxygluconokinase n=1 Tax=Roseibium sediminis TaxID=1775174 RepID=UPI00123DE1CC|nr:5-dehydro-2-deoxygluconokinase [Roseibium sediminis]
MLLDAIAKNNFVIVGRAGIDFYTDAGVRAEDAETVSVGLGGSAANIGAGICKLGGKAALVTRVSDDSVGSYCIGQLKRYGVDASHVMPVGGEYRNSLAFYESVVEGHRNVIYRNGAADFQMDEADVSRVDYSRYSAMITAGTVFAAEPSRSATFKAFELAKAANLPIIFDVDYRPYSWPSAEVAAEVLSRAASQCDMIVGNDVEFGFMAGDYDKGLEKARELAATTAALVIYKMGEEGAITIMGGEEIRTGIYPVEALKPNGAGDSFMSGLLTSIADGFSLKEAVLRGSACASIVVGSVGCAPAMPTRPELEAFLASHPGPTHS